VTTNQEMIKMTKKKWFRIKYKKWITTRLLSSSRPSRQPSPPTKPIRLPRRPRKEFKLCRPRMLPLKTCINFPK